MPVSVGDASSYKISNHVWVGDGGVWKRAKKIWVGDAGSWKLAYVAPVWWNKMESATSTIGTNLTISGTVAYATAKFSNGMGLATTSDSTNRALIDMIWTPKGCFEFWYKPLYNYNANTGERVLFDFRSTLNFLMTYNTATSGIPTSFGLYMPNSGNTSNIQGYYSIASIAPFLANGLVHVAVVWDKDKGLSGGRSFELYVNGTRAPKTAGTGSDTADIYPTQATFTGRKLLGHSSSTACINGYIDNLKIYDYAKTDFSDRNTE
jgi:hypothetical protein